MFSTLIEHQNYVFFCYFINSNSCNQKKKMPTFFLFWLQKLEQVWGLMYLRATVEKEEEGGGGHWRSW